MFRFDRLRPSIAVLSAIGCATLAAPAFAGDAPLAGDAYVVLSGPKDASELDV